ncbi:MAG: twin-arginine translocation signal domain-containing protein [Planctomycetaceae bacterium]|nr:twin-arginine translocation signal domain-containing protein [Planctomycetaceae bacterium]
MTDNKDNDLSRRDFLVYSTAFTLVTGVATLTDTLANQQQAPGLGLLNSGGHTIYGYS